MGFMDSFGAALSGLQAEEQQRNAQTQQLLLQLVSQNPALAETPEIADALASAFPSSQYPDIPGVIGASREAQLGEEARLREQQLGDVMQQLALSLAPQGFGVDPESDPAEAAADILEQWGIKQSTTRSQAVGDKNTDFLHQYMLHAMDNASDEAQAGMRASGLSGIGKTIGQAIAGLNPLFDRPEPTPTGREASEDYTNVLIKQHDNDLKQVAMFSALAEATGQKMSDLMGMYSTTPDQFTKQFGDDWVRAQSKITTESAGGATGWETRYILGNPEAKAVADAMEADVIQQLENLRNEARIPELNRGKADLVQQTYGIPMPPNGGVVMPNGDESLVHPELIYGVVSPEVDQLLTQAQGNPVLQDAYTLAMQMAAQQQMEPGELAEQMVIIRDQLQQLRIIPNIAME